jgi:hypothetical protein
MGSDQIRVDGGPSLFLFAGEHEWESGKPGIRDRGGCHERNSLKITGVVTLPKPGKDDLVKEQFLVGKSATGGTRASFARRKMSLADRCCGSWERAPVQKHGWQRVGHVSR